MLWKDVNFDLCHGTSISDTPDPGNSVDAEQSPIMADVEHEIILIRAGPVASKGSYEITKSCG